LLTDCGHCRRILGPAGLSSKDEAIKQSVPDAGKSFMESGMDYADDGVSEPQDRDNQSDAERQVAPAGVDCINVRYLRSYIDDAAYELSQGKN